eukprot:CAMPEP_0194031262 /NCGR_PEP_ID=MMETSP0009_2-20130614/4469_1 /TAXON_ID=210454 /ORGANISM="Grammatophora oceanica, Strain CCMP 410" /LENGTH=753 /DNA_ID=CAMNT_0038671363 /DNA_START=30 /DNA_END=2291 /DNA_ORIENTATION=+
MITKLLLQLLRRSRARALLQKAAAPAGNNTSTAVIAFIPTTIPRYGRNNAWVVGAIALAGTTTSISLVAFESPVECEAPATTTSTKPSKTDQLRSSSSTSETGTTTATATATNNIATTTEKNSDTSTSNSMTSFQVIAALDMHEEVQRVRMAQLLHDLYEIAKTTASGREGDDASSDNNSSASEYPEDGSNNLKRYSTVRRMWKFVNKAMIERRQTLPASSVPSEHISIEAEFFENMTQTKAHDLIQQLEKGALLSPYSVLDLLYTAEKALLKEETVIDFRQSRKGNDEDALPDFSKVTVVGDLHGSVKSLQHVLTVVGDFVSHKDHAIVFDGDFVDRGDNSLGVLLILLLLKLAYPKNVFLLRGNHEDVLVASAYGFQDELVQKYGADEADDIWDGVNAAFCALPLCIISDTAVILHGGIPTADFDLDQIRDITPSQRKRMKSLVEPKNALETLVQGIVWSDPCLDDGISFNSIRSVGCFFGPNITRDFLTRHSSKYLVRGHQPIPGGTQELDCGDGKSVVTVFSQPNYPNGVGNNLGAFIRLTKDGGLETVQFSRQTEIATNLVCSQDDDEHYMDTLRSLICRHKNKLEKLFQEEAPSGKMSTSHWASVMSSALELPQVPWMVLCADLTPVSEDGNEINWNDFLQLYESSIFDAASTEDNVSMEVLHANQDMIMTTFKFLDRDGNGTIDKDDFKAGITLLNKRLRKDRQMKDPDALFDQLDREGHGEIGLSELREMFELMSSQGNKAAAAN